METQQQDKRPFRQLLLDYTNRDRGHERKKGRYWASDIYNIRCGRLTPENFYTKEPIGLEGCQRITTGIASEAMLAEILEELGIEHEHEPKKVLEIAEGVELVVKPDFVFPDKIIETKHPSKQYVEIPKWYLDQLECEHRAFGEKPTYLGVLSYPFNLTTIPYKPSKIRWSNIKKILINFHNQL